MSVSRHACRILVMCCMAAASPAQAQNGIESPAGLDALVADFLGARVGEPGGAASPVDRRLRLAACPERVELSRIAAGNVAVACRPLGWRIRVPLTEGGGGSAGASTRAASRAAGLDVPLVSRGDQVQLLVRRGSVTVTATGVAMDAGGEGERIRIRIGDSRSPVAGYVLRDGRVSADPLN